MAFIFLLGKGGEGGSCTDHTGSLSKEWAATLWEFCSLFVSAPLHAADTKISHVIGFARQGGEC